MPSGEVFEFQAETSQLLKLVVNSLYTNKDIFLRELISNSSDALDRLRFESLTSPGLVADDHPFEIRLESDSRARTLTVSDTGIGMSRDEVVANIGTIAKSGTRELLAEAEAGANRELLTRLIGQFGVGFYSVFMVADMVVLVTRRPGESAATRWESAGDGRFTVSETVRERSGTSVTLHLKPVDEEAGLNDYCDTRVLERIVKRHSDFITYPIHMKVERSEPERDDEGKIVPDGATRKVVEDRTLNAMKPIWVRPPSEVSEQEYAEFYRHVAHDWSEPLETLPLKAEGRLEYRALLFIPAQAPIDMGLGLAEHGLQLYAKQVMIMERCQDLLEPYLRFVRGVVDSADLPLNVSREMLQHDRHLVQMRTWLTGKVLKTLEEMQRKDEEKYLKLWRQFGRILKEGAATDRTNRERLSRLLMFSTTAEAEALIPLATYVSRMQPGQEEIYYLTGESRTVLEGSPHLEAFRSRDIEVLLLTDPVDELVVESLGSFDDKKLRSIAKGDVALGPEEEREQARKALDEQAKDLTGLLEALQGHLEEQIKEVRLSSRLKSSPACLVGSEHDMSPQLERFLRASPYPVPQQKRILELNPSHAVVERLRARFDADPEDPGIAEGAELLLGYARIAEGSELPDPVRFNQLLVKLLERAV